MYLNHWERFCFVWRAIANEMYWSAEDALTGEVW